MAPAEQDEWEYEYDDNETEDFYIPIDLANVPVAQSFLGTGGPKGHPTLLKTKLRALNAERRETEVGPSAQSAEEAEVSIDKIQIIGLHTENPLMMYRDQLLSCEWNQTIGTDLIFAKPESVAGEAIEPLRSLPSVDLLATSSAKLVARAAQMRPRDDLFDDEPKVIQQSPAKETDAPKENEASAVTEDGGEVVPGNATNVPSASATEGQPTQPAPSSFLGRLNAVKARRGEASRLALSTAPGGPRLVSGKETAAGDDTVMGGT